MNSSAEARPTRSLPNLLRTADLAIRVALILQGLGTGWRLRFGSKDTEADVVGLLHKSWGWGEMFSQRVETGGAIAYLVAACVILVLGCRRYQTATPADHAAALDQRGNQLLSGLETALLCYLFAWQLFLATTRTMTGVAPYSALAIPEQALRILAPLGIWLLNRPWGQVAAEWVLRVAAVVTFAAHGCRAIGQDPTFVDYLLSTSNNLAGRDLGQANAETALLVIGGIDLVLATLLLCRRWPEVAIYMATWGLITALSPLTAHGFDQWPAALVPATHIGVPLAILLYWRAVYPK